MAEKIKKTRPELLKQRRSLALFQRFLPTLILKKQQIQMEILKVRIQRKRIREEIERMIRQIEPWVILFSEDLPGSVTDFVHVKKLERGEMNIAGIRLPVLKQVEYEIKPYSRLVMPAWVDAGVEFVKNLLQSRERLKVLVEQERLLHIELRKVTQRVNLFEKVMIPRAKENIRGIRINLAEEQTAGVSRAKIAKGKTAGEAGA